MSQDDVVYLLEILKESIENKDWDLIQEAVQYLEDFREKDEASENSEYSDE